MVFGRFVRGSCSLGLLATFCSIGFGHDLTPTVRFDYGDKSGILGFSRQGLTDVARWPNVDGPYTSVYKYRNNSRCPNSILIDETFMTDSTRRISITNHSDIVEDAAKCDPSGVLVTADIPFLLSEEGKRYAERNYGNLTRRLNANPNARSALTTFEGSRLGFDDWPAETLRSRKCGDAVYDESAFWFHVIGGNGNKVVISTSTGQRDTIHFPPKTKGIFLMASGNRLCILQTPPFPDTTQPVTTTTVRTTTRRVTLTNSNSGGGDNSGGGNGGGNGGESSTSSTAPSLTTSTSAQRQTTTSTSSISSTTVTTPTTTTETKAEEDNGSACFPGNAQVELENGISIAMDKLRVGDRVKVGPNEFSRVFAFTHKTTDVISTFVRIRVLSGEELILSPGHFLYINGDLAPARATRPGDEVILGSGEVSRIRSVDELSSKGLFNPQTLQGDVVVNGVVTSTYTTAIAPTTAHALLAILRSAFLQRGWYTTAFESGATRVASYLPRARGIF